MFFWFWLVVWPHFWTGRSYRIHFPALRTVSHFVAYSFRFPCFRGLLRTASANFCSKLLDSRSSSCLLVLLSEIDLSPRLGVSLNLVQVGRSFIPYLFVVAALVLLDLFWCGFPVLVLLLRLWCCLASLDWVRVTGTWQIRSLVHNGQILRLRVECRPGDCRNVC